MEFISDQMSSEFLNELYQSMVLPRMVEEKMLLLLRQGKISKWFSGIGQEAISVGATKSLDPDEYILPMHRNLGVFTSRKVPLDKLFAQLQGKVTGFSKGRDRSFHFGSKKHFIVGMISHVGAQLSVANGIALAEKLDNRSKVTLVFCGEGSTSEGEFHEALNVASVWNLPVIFLIENNQYALSTPTHEQFKCEKLSDKGIGYGMEAHQIDGNNIFDVYTTITKIAENIKKNPRPVLIEALTFRVRGHEEASGTKYVPDTSLNEWLEKDPIGQFERHLLKEQVLTPQEIQQIRAKFEKKIQAELEKAFSAQMPDPGNEEGDVYAPGDPIPRISENVKTKKCRFVDAISNGIKQCLEQKADSLLMGQDVAEYGGVFKVTQGLVDVFGKERVRNTPLCESSIIGAGLGLSIKGYKSIIEMQFADFAACGFNQIVNNLAKVYYRWGQKADVVIRMPTGAGVGAGPFHSQSNEAWFFHTPGLKVVYPSTPYAAKGLLISAFEDPNPVMYFEHKYLYRKLSDKIPESYYGVPIGEAKLLRKGNEISIVTYGLGVHWAIEYLDKHKRVGADLIDLQTLLPWDKEAVASSLKKTGKLLILHEDCLTGGIGGEISAWVSENCFEYLDAPIFRVAGLDTPVPFSPPLEDHFLPQKRFYCKMKELLAY